MQALGLALLHPHHAEGLAHLLEVLGQRRHDDPAPAGPQHAGDLADAARSEHRRHEVDGTGREGQSAPHVRTDGGDAGVGARGPAQRRGRGLDDDARSAGGLDDGREVVPGPPADVDDEPGDGAVGERRRDGCVVPGAEERVAGGDHPGVVPARGATDGEVDVPLAGEVEAVPRNASQDRPDSSTSPAQCGQRSAGRTSASTAGAAFSAAVPPRRRAGAARTAPRPRTRGPRAASRRRRARRRRGRRRPRPGGARRRRAP